MSFINRVKKTNLDNLFLLKGTDNSKLCWHYVLVNQLKLPIFKREIKALPKRINFLDYGEIAFSGWGENPPAELVKLAEKGEKKSANDISEIFHYVGINKANGKFFAFVKVEAILKQKFENITSLPGEEINLEDWGEVVKWGWGEASKEDFRKIEEEFGLLVTA